MADRSGWWHLSEEEPAPVAHLSEADYADEAKRRDWQKQGFAVVPAFADHPLEAECAACRPPAEPRSPKESRYG